MAVVWLFIVFVLNIFVMNIMLFLPLELLQSLYPSPLLLLLGGALLFAWCFGDS